MKYLITLLIFLAGCQPAHKTIDREAIPEWGLGPFVRDEGADRLGPIPESVFHCPVMEKEVQWEGKDLLCAAAVVREGKVYLFYRAEDMTAGETFGMSRIGLAVSEDGRHFNRHPEPVLYPDHDFMLEYEWPGGCEDPRVMETEDGTYVMTYTSWDKKVGRLCVATSRDLLNWTKHGPAIGTCKASKYRDLWSKSGSVVCRRDGEKFIATKINGKYWMYFGDTGFMLASSDNLTDWDVVEDDNGKPMIVLPQRQGMFDGLVVEPGPPAFLTDRGIFMIYNGGARDRPDLGLTGTVWVMAQVLFDVNDPAQVLARTSKDFFHPERSYEIRHMGTAGNSNVTFIESLVWFNDEWRFYYGCADSWVASAVYQP